MHPYFFPECRTWRLWSRIPCCGRLIDAPHGTLRDSSSSAEGSISALNVDNAIAYMYIDAEKAVCVRIGCDARTVPQAAPRCELTVLLQA